MKYNIELRAKLERNMPYVEAMFCWWQVFWNCFSHPWILVCQYSLRCLPH